MTAINMPPLPQPSAEPAVWMYNHVRGWRTFYVVGDCNERMLAADHESAREYPAFQSMTPLYTTPQLGAEDYELSAALGWPGGINDPVTDRKKLLDMVTELRYVNTRQKTRPAPRANSKSR